MKQLLAGLWLIIFLSGPVSAADTPDGWGNLKFGMSIDEARTAEPRLNGEIAHTREKYQHPDDLNNKKPLIARYWHPYSLNSTQPTITFGDGQFYLMTRYNENKSLYEIELERHTPDDPAITEAVCEKLFERNLSLLAKEYGIFDEERKYNDFISGAQITPRKTADGQIPYFRGIKARFTGAPEGSVAFKARKTFSPTLDEITITALRYPHLSSCEVRIRFYKYLAENDIIPGLQKAFRSKDKF